MSRSSNVFQDPAARPLGRWVVASVVLGIVLLVLGLWLYNVCRIDVPKGSIAILIRKTGKEITNGDEVAPTPGHKGVQAEVLGEGRYFYNPYTWDWKVVPQFEVPADKLGVRIRLVGEDLGYGEFLARQDSEGNFITKGIVAEVLRPGRYPINPYVEKVELHSPVTVPAGFKGVVTNLAGPIPTKADYEPPHAGSAAAKAAEAVKEAAPSAKKQPAANAKTSAGGPVEAPPSIAPHVRAIPTARQLLVKEGFRGVQLKTLEPGTYYVNPYVMRVNQIDCRDYTFRIAEQKDMGFPSKDGFWVRLDGKVVFHVDPARAAEVFVTFNDVKNDASGTRIDEEIINKVILPNARSFCRIEGSDRLGREFISARTEFEEKFQAALRAACKPLGIEIVEAVITTVHPPKQIATPVAERELAIQQEQQFHNEIEQQKAEQQKMIETEMRQQKQLSVQAEQSVVKVTTQAKREQEVAVTMAKQRLEVAKVKLQAAKDEAEAILARGRAAAEVVRFENQAEAAGWKRAVEAFGGSGAEYARYVLLQKMSAAYRDIMVNTADSPIMKIFESFSENGKTHEKRMAPKEKGKTN